MKHIWGDHSFLRRLRHDVRGNTIALVAAALIPLAGMIGGAVDMSRLYLTKTRLQQACDAGVLAGRKVMATGAWTTGHNNGSAQAKAEEMFTANFAEGAYGTGALLRDFKEKEGTVTGTATIAVPMTIMRIFGITQRNLDVSCTAKMEIPNTDVMFVLDVTGSMNCPTGVSSCTNNNNKPATNARIVGLKSAVKCFYEALLRVNTNEVCGNDPTTTTYAGTAQIRIGFVPYSVNVNLGKLLPNEYLADKWTYQSRQAVLNANAATTVSEGKKSNWSAYNTYTTYTNKTYTDSTCKALRPANDSAAVGSETSPQNQAHTVEGVLVSWATTTPYADYQYDYSVQSGKCTITRSSRTYTVTTSYSKLKNYIYKPVEIDIRSFKAGGSNWNNSINLNLGTDGAAAAIAWDGCIEERQTVKASNSKPAGEWSPIPAAAYDLDIDMIPNSGKSGSYWGPILNNAVWGRFTGTSTNNRTVDTVTTTSDLSRNTSYYCSTEAKKLQTWYTPGGFEAYVNSLSAIGNTYHDIGMIWGARFISPTGIFASENAETTKGGAIQRHIIFMTDGDTQTSINNLTAYGIHWWDRRQTDYEPTATKLDNILNARLAGLCTAIKNRNIALWVVSYGGDTSTETEDRLKTCATPGKYFSAKDTPTLIANFKQIAAEIAELRLIN